ncbi:hypothetical protein [Haploplasma axanthum]|uniref:Uncharacterized protein n=1 Tax=Haploplasma axanthum TaxID=29552 RepID=A0A449BDU8_HAPAX|nr:hypothetical protein [Haploplasma axanthum]VEU80619.1 Uncharacterised protein [Haploplasma axanthum]
MLLILFLLASPFIIAIFTVFFVVYLIVCPVEILIYKRSNYYKDLQEKYYLFITRNNNYLLYNKLRKEAIPTKITINNETYESYKSKDMFLIFVEYKVEFSINNLLVNSNNNNSILRFDNLNYVYVIKRNMFVKNDDYKIAKTIKNIIIYE